MLLLDFGGDLRKDWCIMRIRALSRGACRDVNPSSDSWKGGLAQSLEILIIVTLTTDTSPSIMTPRYLNQFS